MAGDEGLFILGLRVIAEQAISKENGCQAEENGKYNPLNKAVPSAVHASYHINSHMAKQ